MTTRNWTIHPVIVTAIIINVAVLALAVALSGSDPAPLSRLLTEDRLVEWMQFMCFVALSGMLAFVAVERARRDGFSFQIVALAGLSVLVALAAGEEISWFQRVLGIDSPEYFRLNNRQAETNLHNIAMGGGSIHKTILLKLIAIVGLLHNLVLPFVARFKPAVRIWVESLGGYLPPLWSGVVYLALVALSHLLIDHPRKGELGEMFGATHYLATAFAAYMLGLGYDRPKVIENDADGRRVSTLFAMFMVLLLFVSWMLAAGQAARVLAS